MLAGQLSARFDPDGLMVRLGRFVATEIKVICVPHVVDEGGIS